MRIAGKRASYYTQSEIINMLIYKQGPNGEYLREPQINELWKVYKIRSKRT